MKREILVFVVFFLVVFNVFGLNLIGRFYSNGPVRPGDEYELLVVARNPMLNEIEDVSARLYFYNLGVRVQSVSVDIDDKDSALLRLNWDVPNIPRGLYLTRLNVGNDDYLDSKHLLVRVI